jgi:hypothetical protein
MSETRCSSRLLHVASRFEAPRTAIRNPWGRHAIRCCVGRSTYHQRNIRMDGSTTVQPQGPKGSKAEATRRLNDKRNQSADPGGHRTRKGTADNTTYTSVRVAGFSTHVGLRACARFERNARRALLMCFAHVAHQTQHRK